MIRSLYRFVNRNWWQILTALILSLMLMAFMALSGCVSSDRQMVTTERVKGIRDGQTCDYISERREDERERVAVEVPQVVGAIASATGGGVDWATLAAGIGAAATTATTGYLAIKKRQQMKGGKSS